MFSHFPKVLLVILLSLVFSGGNSFAQPQDVPLEKQIDAKTIENDDTLTISLLTCTPGHEIHRLYGHTALRIQSPSEDWAVNFGWFSFNTPNFIGKFILGLTDYSMAYQTMPIFILDLQRDDMMVKEQVLNLTPAEAKAVSEAMKSTLDKQGCNRHDYHFNAPDGTIKTETILGAKWTYRYNFLYDNCTTRAVDAIFSALAANGEQIMLSPEFKNQVTTQRGMIHEFTVTSPWYEFGQDLLLGPEVDEAHSKYDLAMNWQDWVNRPQEANGQNLARNFLPTYAENFFDVMEITDSAGNHRPMVARSNNLTPFLTPQPDKPASPISPMLVAGILLAFSTLSVVSTLRAQKKKDSKILRAWTIWGNAFDITAWTLQGCIGILLIIMVGWSEHPAVGTNWLLFFFNPLYFLCIPARFLAPKVDKGLGILSAVASAFLIVGFGLGLQGFPSALVVMMAASLLRALLPVLRVKTKVGSIN